MGFFGRIIKAIKRIFKKGVNEAVDGQITNTINTDINAGLTKIVGSTVTIYAASTSSDLTQTNGFEQKSNDINTKARSSKVVTEESPLSSQKSIKEIKFCGGCKQPCDINDETCPICGSSHFRSATPVSEDTEK